MRLLLLTVLLLAPGAAALDPQQAAADAACGVDACPGPWLPPDCPPVVERTGATNASVGYRQDCVDAWTSYGEAALPAAGAEAEGAPSYVRCDLAACDGPRFPPTCKIFFLEIHSEPPDVRPVYRQGCVDEWEFYVAELVQA